MGACAHGTQGVPRVCQNQTWRMVPWECEYESKHTQQVLCFKHVGSQRVWTYYREWWLNTSEVDIVISRIMHLGCNYHIHTRILQLDKDTICNTAGWTDWGDRMGSQRVWTYYREWWLDLELYTWDTLCHDIHTRIYYSWIRIPFGCYSEWGDRMRMGLKTFGTFNNLFIT